MAAERGRREDDVVDFWGADKGRLIQPSGWCDHPRCEEEEGKGKERW